MAPMTMPRLTVALALLALVPALAGCGQKGNLYLPESEPTVPPVLEEDDARARPMEDPEIATPAPDDAAGS